ncbi:MAG: F-type +-transporting ATPase subunit b [Candidatus Peribacteria bacterium]|nr:F-type +-transporting ATPase subunit b [Candidatus Peribacteria bacterium]
MALLTTLGINWGMLIAQMVNFVILMAALSYFLYKPVLRVIDDRRERVKKTMDDAKKLEQEVKDMEKQRAERLKSMDADAKEFLQKAKEYADKFKQDAMATAQQEASVVLEKGRKQVEDERHKMIADVQATISNVSITLAEKILEREFTPKDQERILKTLEKDIPSLIK